MTGNASDFEALKLEAARKFAQTMIVIDDEASQQNSETLTHPPKKTLQTPTRKSSFDAEAAEPLAEQGQSGKDTVKFPLNAKLLIENAMTSGLICSVLRPKKGDNLLKRVVNAAEIADIVCLDWEIHNDGGNTASKIIETIIQKDAEQNGRLRLIAIYTGEKKSYDIMNKIFNAIPEKLIKDLKLKKTSLKIESSNGVRIVCLFKANGVRLFGPQKANQIKENQLPERLQTEFSRLSEGLLSNVALAAIASIRTSTHHVLSKFTGQMDGPFFHHRASIESPDDAEEYAVDIVLSELKGAVDKHQVAANYAGSKATEKRIREIAGSGEKLTLHYEKKGKPGTFDLGVDYAISIIRDGLSYALKEDRKPSDSPANGQFEENLSTLFSNSSKAAHRLMHQFAALTCVQAHPGSHLYRFGKLLPKLGLGTIIQDKDKTCLMCLQASCDSVRIKGKRSFLFVPLDKEKYKPEYVVPITTKTGKSEFAGFSVSSKSYCKARSIFFLTRSKAGTVNAKKTDGENFHFKDTKNNRYLWIADLKHHRALHTVQRLGQHMGRLGVDEFEPYRSKK